MIRETDFLTRIERNKYLLERVKREEKEFKEKKKKVKHPNFISDCPMCGNEVIRIYTFACNGGMLLTGSTCVNKKCDYTGEDFKVEGLVNVRLKNEGN